MAVGGKRKRNLFQIEMIGEVLKGITLGLDLKGKQNLCLLSWRGWHSRKKKQLGQKQERKAEYVLSDLLWSTDSIIALY